LRDNLGLQRKVTFGDVTLGTSDAGDQAR